MHMAIAPIRPLISKIQGVLTLSSEEMDALLALPVRIADLNKGDVIVREGDRRVECCVVISGVTCMFKHSGEGKRQILILHFAGDMPDLQNLHLDIVDIGLGALSPCRVGMVQHADVRRLYAKFPRLGDALWRSTLVDTSILREWMLNIGQRNARARMAHFFCEIVVRTKLAGLDLPEPFPLMLTQRDIGDALGLSHMHVNRVAQEMREEGLIDLSRGKLAVPDWERLQNAADFDLTYLHLTPVQRAVFNRGCARKVRW